MKFSSIKDIEKIVPKKGSFKYYLRKVQEDGRIVKGVNTTADVGVNQIPIEAKKLGNKVDKDGKPPTLSTKVKGKSTNVLFNLGLAESKVDISREDMLYLKQMKEELGEISKTTKIYVDMDGVLADFFGAWAKLMGKTNYRDIKDVGAGLQKIKDTENFWLRLPLTKNAYNLLSIIAQVKGEYYILSSPLPGDPNSDPHKRQWVKKNLSNFPPKEVIITHNKEKFAQNDDGTPNILIDDYGVNINKWESAGGIGFKHKDHKFERTAKAIKQKVTSEGQAIPNPKNSFLTKADTAYDFIKVGTNMANLKSMPKGSNKDEPDIMISPYAGEKEMKYLMKQLKRIGYDVQDAGGYQDAHFDDNKTGGEAPPQIKGQGRLGKIKLKSLKGVQRDRTFEKLLKQLPKVKEGTYEPITVDPRGYIVNGHHRLDALRLLDKKYAKVRMLDKSVNEIMTDHLEENFLKNIGAKIKDKAIKLKNALSKEGGETAKMMDIYKRALQKKASPQEIQQANTQFKDVLKMVGLGAFSAIPIPGAGLLILAVEKLLQKQGMSVLPTAFQGSESMAFENFAPSKKKISEGYQLKLERDKGANLLVLHMKDTKTGNRSEVRGKLGYEHDGYDPNDKLHQLLDKIGKAANISDLMNGDVVHINPKHPQGPKAIKIARKITTESIKKDIITPDLKKLDSIFKKGKHEIRIIGGAVRDIALGKEPKDIDLATDATPEEMQKLLDKAGIKHKPTGIEHGTITAIIGGEGFEITTLRADKETDGRRAEVEFVRSWEEDAKRRDLTYNAMSMDFSGKIYDYHGGMDDLQNKVSKFVGDPAERIKEDYLRILRYFRFQGRLDSPKWEDNVLKAIKSNVNGLSKISVERIWQEISKLLAGKNVASILDYMGKTGVAKAIGLPVTNAKQVNDSEDPVIALAKLVDNDEVAKRWKLSNQEHTTLLTLVKNKNKELTQQKVQDLIIDGADRDIIAKLAQLQGKKDLISLAKSFKAPEFPVTGNDLIAKGLKSGPELGQKLKDLKQKWKQSGYKATKDQLLGENFADGIKFVEPNFNSEWEEANRYPEFQKIGKQAWIELAKKGKAITIKSAKDINNTDAGDPNSFKSLDPNKQKRALAQLEKGTVELPIVAVYSDGYKELIGGNTRLTAMMARDGVARLWQFEVPDEVAELAENFADGKVKGKSRPGRVKRAGASCNGSVTSLRKKAKNASGEKAKMYHWCANMKSGRKKKS